MDDDVRGRRVLAVVTNYGVEQDELMVPVERLRAAGAEVDIAAVDAGTVQTLVGDKDPGVTVQPDTTIADADTDAYDMLLVPGGTLNADKLRQDADAVAAVGSFVNSRRPVAAICHGPWALVEAGVTRDKTLTSYPSLATDIRNSGGDWVDEPVVNDGTGGWTLVTSRRPKDLEPFIAQIGRTLDTGRDR